MQPCPRYDGLRPDFGNEACFFDKDNSLANFVFFHALLIVIQVKFVDKIAVYFFKSTPLNRYQKLEVHLLQITNVIFFVLTISALHSTWRKARTIRKQASIKKDILVHHCTA